MGKATAGDLPVGAGSFVGRAGEVSELVELLGRDRLVTLTGAPGIGKSRLAVELAGQLVEDYPGGVHVVQLAPVTRPVGIARALASALSVDELPGQRLTDTLLARIGERRLLVVLDNCEHLLDPCAELVDTLLCSCPQLGVLATSREPLQVAVERVWQVPPLAVPRPEDQALPAGLLGYAAVALFVDRARAAQPEFSFNAFVAPAVAEICRRLDGIPLAIELAAARVQSLTPAEIAGHLGDRFSLLRDGSSSSLPRHQTLKAALDWSHELLAEPECALLRRLSVFAGGFSLEAAEAVCLGGEVKAGQVFELLAGLVAKSLVVTNASDGPQTAYRLLETVRAYASDKLQQAGETGDVREAHARWCLDLAERAEPELTGPDQQRWLQRLQAERDNLRSAFEWSLGHGQTDRALRLAGALVLFWRIRCHFSEGRELLDAAVSASDGVAMDVRAKSLWGAGFMALMVGDRNSAIPALEESLSGYRELNDLQGCARALLVLGNCRQYSDPSGALSLLEESAELAREAGDPWCLSHALGVAGLEYVSRCELTTARARFEECLLVARQGQDKDGLGLALFGLGSVVLRQGDYRLAESLLEEGVAITQALGEDYAQANALQYLGELAIGQGDWRRAHELLERALAILREVGSPSDLLGPLVLLARALRAEGDRFGARRLFEEALAGPYTPLPALQGLGELAAEDGDLRTARAHLDQSLGSARANGGHKAVAEALHGLGHLARAEGDPKRAVLLHEEALRVEWQAGNAPAIPASLEALAGLAAVGGRYAHAAHLLGAAQALRDAHGYARVPWESSRWQADVAVVRQGLSGEAFEAAWAEGTGLSTEEAAALALKPRPRRPANGWSSLTESERRVADLVAEGLGNPQIAQRLGVSLGTVKSHLTHIFSKLGVTGRTELAREVWRREHRAPEP